METQTLQVEVRKESGKGAARQLRARGRLPAVLYGDAGAPQSLSVSPKDLSATLSTEYGRNILLKLQLNGQEELAIVKELQIDPVSRAPLHVDFFKIRPERPVLVDVPIATKGRAKGQIKGGTLKPLFRVLPIKATADRVPARIEIDVTELDVNQNIRVKNLQLPEGVVVRLPDERPVLTILAERKRGAAEEEQGEAKA